MKAYLSMLKKEHHQARHVCYAYIIGYDQEHFKAADDGEPANTAGQPILGQIRSSELTNTLVAVVRYFGGTKLGKAGLIRAYKQGAKLAIAACKIQEQYIENSHTISFPYSVLDRIMYILDSNGVHIKHQNFDIECTIQFDVRLSEEQTIVNKLSKIATLQFK